MSEWMWVAIAIVAIIAIMRIFDKWVTASAKVDQILNEELRNDDRQNNPEER